MIVEVSEYIRNIDDNKVKHAFECLFDGLLFYLSLNNSVNIFEISLRLNEIHESIHVLKKVIKFGNYWSMTKERKSCPYFKKSIIDELESVIDEIMKLAKDQVVPKCGLMVNNNLPFQHKKCFDKLVTYVLDIADKWMKSSYDEPSIGVICQSTGHGKTRCIKELANNYCTIYIDIGNGGITATNQKNNPMKSMIARKFLNAMRYESTGMKFVWSAIMGALDIVEDLCSVQNTQDNVNNIQNLFTYYQSWDNQSTECVEHFLKRIDFNEFCIKKFIENCYVDETTETLERKWKSVLNNDMPCILLFVIDNADRLLEYKAELFDDNCEHMNMLSAFKASLKEISRNIRVSFLLVGSNPKLVEQLNADNTSKSETNLARKCNFYKMSSDVLFYDSFMPTDSAQLLQSFASQYESYNRNNSGLFNWIAQRDPTKDLFYYGRPLWSSLLLANSNINEIFDLAKCGLISKQDWSDMGKKSKNCAVLAIISIRCTFQIKQANKFDNDQVAKHMSTIYYVSECGRDMSCKYFSEPILAEIASQCMSDENVMCDILKTIKIIISKLPFYEQIQVRYLVLEIILLLAKDDAVRKRNLTYYSTSVSLHDYLKSLIGEDNASKIYLSETMKNGRIYFTHFIKKHSRLKRKDVVLQLIGRCAAATQDQSYEKLIDFIIPIILENGKIMYLFIKLTSENYVSDEFCEINKSKLENNVFDGIIEEETNNCFNLFLLVNTSTDTNLFLKYEKKNSSQFLNHYFVSGLDNFKFLRDTEKKEFKDLVKCMRDLSMFYNFYGSKL